jgi:hypothetical protein
MYRGTVQGCRQGGGGLGGLQPPPSLTDQLTLSQPGGADYAPHSTTSPPGFSGPATGLLLCVEIGFMWTFPRNQDATVKLKSEFISIKF